MADVFVSYARESEALAKAIADALTADGYDVWWDTKLLPHHSFAEAIERQVREAKVVVVVWSEHATASQWVRAEADLGRALGKLVQVSADRAPLPLPFNQFQSARLEGWSGDVDDPRWRKVVASVAQLTGRGAPERATERLTSPPAPVPVSRRPRGARTWAVAAGIVVLLALLGIALALILRRENAPTRIAVQPFDVIGGDSRTRDFAAALRDSLEGSIGAGRLPTVSRADAEGLRGASDAKLKSLGVRLLFTGSVQAEADALNVRLRLDDPLQHAAIWNAELAGPAAQADALQAQVGARANAVLGCSGQAFKPKGGLTDSTALALLFRACDLAVTSGHGGEDPRAAFGMLDAFRQVIARAPNFADAHAQLAKHGGYLTDFMAPSQAAPLRAEADREARQALKLDPRSTDAYVALGLLAPRLDFKAREKPLLQALAIDPDWPHANGFLGTEKVTVGRVKDAAVLWQRAASANPLILDWSTNAAAGLSFTGHTDESEAEFARLTELWPNDPGVWAARLNNLVLARRWDDALAQLDRARGRPRLSSAQAVEQDRGIYLALKSNDSKALAAARADVLKDASDPFKLPQVIDQLLLLGDVENAFVLASRYPATPYGITPMLFGQNILKLEYDKRFIPLAARFGLVNYWRQTGQWPDFCSAPDLPYDCKREAALLSRAPQPQAPQPAPASPKRNSS